MIFMSKVKWWNVNNKNIEPSFSYYQHQLVLIDRKHTFLV